MMKQYLVFGLDYYYPSGGPHDFLGVASSPEDFDPVHWARLESEPGDMFPRFWDVVILCRFDGQSMELVRACEVSSNDFTDEITAEDVDPKGAGFGL